jgi:hypothetical protein
MLATVSVNQLRDVQIEDLLRLNRQTDVNSAAFGCGWRVGRAAAARSE